MTQAAIKLLLLGAIGGWALDDLLAGQWGRFLLQLAAGAGVFCFVQPRPFST